VKMGLTGTLPVRTEPEVLMEPEPQVRLQGTVSGKMAPKDASNSSRPRR